MRIGLGILLVITLTSCCPRTLPDGYGQFFYYSKDNKTYICKLYHNAETDIIVSTEVDYDGPQYNWGEYEVGNKASIMGRRGKIVGREDSWILLNIPIEQGMSGSPVLVNGCVVGVTARKVIGETFKSMALEINHENSESGNSRGTVRPIECGR